jgi:ubiquinone biosynthesis protein COQ9
VYDMNVFEFRCFPQISKITSVLSFLEVYATCQNSGVPWLSCKSVAKWANDECQNSTWCQFGAAVSASYVQHVLKRFYIPDEVQGMYMVTKYIENN